jgi:hypothetical protein
MESQAGNVNTVAAKARHRTASVTWTLDMENLKGSKGEESEDPHHTCCRQTQSNPKSDLIWTLNAKLEREVVLVLINLASRGRAI